MKTRLLLIVMAGTLLAMNLGEAGRSRASQAAPGGAQLAGKSPSPPSLPPTRPRQAALANDHLTAIVLIQRWARGIYHLVFGAGGEPPKVGPWIDNGDGTFTQVVVSADGTRTVITSYGPPDHWDQAISHPDGIREFVTARPLKRAFDQPDIIQIEHVFSTGDTMRYRLDLQQEVGLTPEETGGAAIMWVFGLLSQGEVRLAGGQCMDFEFRQTLAFDCYNFFRDTFLPEEICNEWFMTHPDFGFLVPRPDRLFVRLCGTPEATLSMEFPILFPQTPDFSVPATGRFTFGRETFTITLSTDTPEVPGWKLWETLGPDYRGLFQLGAGFSGRGQALETRRRGRPRLHFAARWDQRGIGVVILPNGQTRPAGPLGGAMEFGQLRWSGLAAAFGPSPGGGF